jgi:hypothetical protein
VNVYDVSVEKGIGLDEVFCRISVRTARSRGEEYTPLARLTTCTFKLEEPAAMLAKAFRELADHLEKLK